jgi:hypothetical protein
VRPGRVLHDLASYLSERLTIGGIEGTKRASGLGDARYDVLGGARSHPTDAEDRGVGRVQSAAHKRLERDDGVREGEYGIVRAVRIGPVAAGSLDGYAQIVRGSVYRAGLDAHRTPWNVRMDVCSNDRARFLL